MKNGDQKTYFAPKFDAFHMKHFKTLPLMDSSEELMSLRMRQQKNVSIPIVFSLVRFIFPNFMSIEWAHTLKLKCITHETHQFDKGFSNLPTFRAFLCWILDVWVFDLIKMFILLLYYDFFFLSEK